jgi:hypothetical protein
LLTKALAAAARQDRHSNAAADPERLLKRVSELEPALAAAKPAPAAASASINEGAEPSPLRDRPPAT